MAHTAVPNLPSERDLPRMAAIELELVLLDADIAEYVRFFHARLDPLLAERAKLRARITLERQRRAG